MLSVLYLKLMYTSKTYNAEEDIDIRNSRLQCFSTFVRPWSGKFFFLREGPGPNKFTRKYLSSFYKFIH